MNWECLEVVCKALGTWEDPEWRFLPEQEVALCDHQISSLSVVLSATVSAADSGQYGMAGKGAWPMLCGSDERREGLSGARLGGGNCCGLLSSCTRPLTCPWTSSWTSS